MSTLGFDVTRTAGDGVETTTARGRNVYVVVSTDDWTKRAMPIEMRTGLTSVAGQGNAVDGCIDDGTVTA